MCALCSVSDRHKVLLLKSPNLYKLVVHGLFLNSQSRGASAGSKCRTSGYPYMYMYAA